MGDFLRFGQFWVGAESILRLLTFCHFAASPQSPIFLCVQLVCLELNSMSLIISSLHFCCGVILVFCCEKSVFFHPCAAIFRTVS